MKNLSNWRSVRLWEQGVVRDLQRRHALWLHGMCIGLLVMGVMWASAHAQMLAGATSLTLRYLATLGVGFLAYLLLLRLWAAALLRPGRTDAGNALDIPHVGGGQGTGAPCEPAGTPFAPGRGGDFAGGGASGDFSGAGDAAANVASGALEAAASADEGAVVVIPVVAIFLIACAVLFGAGSLLLLYFGWEALLTVAVELAFSYASARTAVRVVREGWLSAAVRLTRKPLAGAVACAVLLGASLDYFVPEARSLPHAIKLIGSQR